MGDIYCQILQIQVHCICDIYDLILLELPRNDHKEGRRSPRSCQWSHLLSSKVTKSYTIQGLLVAKRNWCDNSNYVFHLWASVSKDWRQRLLARRMELPRAAGARDLLHRLWPQGAQRVRHWRHQVVLLPECLPLLDEVPQFGKMLQAIELLGHDDRASRCGGVVLHQLVRHLPLAIRAGIWSTGCWYLSLSQVPKLHRLRLEYIQSRHGRLRFNRSLVDLRSLQ